MRKDNTGRDRFTPLIPTIMKLFEKGGVLLSVFHSVIMNTDYQLNNIVVAKW